MQTAYSRYDIDKEILGLAWPTISEQILIMMVGIVSTVLVSRLGKEAMAGVGMVNILINFFQTIFAGLATIANTTVGQNLGKSNYDMAEVYVYENNRLAIIVAIAAAVLEIAFAVPLSKLYSSDYQVIRASVIVTIGFALIEPLLAIERVSASVMRCAGDIRYVIVTSIIALWTFRVAASFVLVKFFHIGLYGVMVGIFLDFCVRGFMYVIRMKDGKWKYLRV
ncbi:hypothetical protein JMF89_14375 [Clostridiaceae bacterium UIB06]|uniref:Probable multidrug resistance protein NorM n=1 Tax=Clostridium thailandense TaxID=2794346 RepID=A0A949WU07_9CLOT|nr:MATE family efflux transporter [Clostridium thailandense]MBV7276920.1 hypothetical protein [Clostridium thailandense]MCH5138379.1 hypothetical protein [Clostridiaceae bacterium UIB06]